MMSLHKPALRRSASTLESTNRGSPLVTPPTSLNLRSSLNQQLGRDITRGGVSVETQGSVVPPKNRQKYALTSLQNAMGLDGSPAPGRVKPVPTKSASSSSLYSFSLSFSPSNPKLAKNGTNLQLKETQFDLSRKDTNRNDITAECGHDWPDVKDDEKNVPFRRRTKSFLEYHRVEEEEEESPVKELQTQDEEKPCLPKLEPQNWAKENRVEAHLTLPQNHLLLLANEEEEEHQSPAHTHLSPAHTPVKCIKEDKGKDGGLKVMSKPHFEGERKETPPTSLPIARSLVPPNSLPMAPLFMAQPKDKQMEEEEEEEDDDSSWTTLSQESPSIETPQETGEAILSSCLSVHLLLYLLIFIYMLIHLSIHPSKHLFTCPFARPPIHPSTYPSMHRSIHLSIHLSVHSPLSVKLHVRFYHSSIYLYAHPPIMHAGHSCMSTCQSLIRPSIYPPQLSFLKKNTLNARQLVPDSLHTSYVHFSSPSIYSHTHLLCAHLPASVFLPLTLNLLLVFKA